MNMSSKKERLNKKLKELDQYIRYLINCRSTIPPGHYHGSNVFYFSDKIDEHTYFAKLKTRKRLLAIIEKL